MMLAWRRHCPMVVSPLLLAVAGRFLLLGARLFTGGTSVLPVFLFNAVARQRETVSTGDVYREP